MKKKIIYLFMALFIASCGSEKTMGISMDGSREAGTVSVASPKVTVQSILSRMDIGKYNEGELLVKFRSGVVATQALKTHYTVGASVLTRFNILSNLEHVKLPEGMSVKDAVINYMSDPNVEYAEPNYIVSITATPNDTYFSQLWGLHNTGQTVNGTAGTADADMDGPEAWDVQTGSSSVVIAVIDTGVDYNHPDLSANIWTNTGETSCTDGIDNDGNGYVDDCRGWDFYNNDNNPMDDYDNSHGTHVAGTIAAIGNNEVGIAGVNWTAKIMPLKFMDAGGSGSTSDAILAIQYANNKGAHIQNYSWGSYSFSQSLKNAIDASSAVIIAAAGNDAINNDTTPLYPCSYTSSHIICAAATDQNDNLTSFSNYGVISVDVGAPGVNIYSTVLSSSYGFKNGTSTATPHVAGLAGLIKARDSNLTNLQIKDIILNNVDSKASLSGKVLTGGRINAQNAIGGTVPPTNLSCSASSAGEIDLSWTDNSSNETGFKIERKIGAGGTYSEIATVSANVTTYNNTGLSEATTYYYRVRTYNAVGNSSYSSEVSALTFPAAPSGLSASAASTSQIDLSWTDNSGGETGFKIERKAEAIGTYSEIATPSANTTTYSDTGLSASTTYYYRVRAYNASGNSTYSSETSATTPAPPSSGSSGGGGGGGCFIATAAYGSYLAPEVMALRNFRDKYLLTNSLGRTFVEFYYNVSPPVAEYISGREGLKTLTRLALAPVVYGLKYPFVFLIFMGLIIMRVFYKKAHNLESIIKN